MAGKTDTEKDSSRLWATIVYPDSAPADWINILKDTLIPCYVSPLHDKDHFSDEREEELKKPHYHIFLIFPGQRTRKIVRGIVELFAGVGAERVLHKVNYVKYLTHSNAPEKHQYDPSEVQVFNGAMPYEELIQDGNSVYELVGEMIEWCSTNTYYFADLVDYSRVNRYDWFKVLCDRNSALIWQYIKSRTWRDNQQENQ